MAGIAVIAIGACGGTRLLVTEGLPDATVAVVSQVPADLGTVTKTELRYAVVQQSAQENSSSLPQAFTPAYRRLQEQALVERLETIWIQGQAIEMGISVTPRQIARELADIKEASFKSEAAYRHFLSESHFTRRDVAERVKVQLLSQAIQTRASQEAAPQPTAQEKAFGKFVQAYQKKWRARTVCAPAYAIDQCSSAPPPR